LALSTVGLAVIGFFPNQSGLIAGTAVFACGVAFTFPALLSLAVSRVSPDERGTVVGTTSLFLDLSFGLAPVALGAVAEVSGYPAVFLVGAAASAVGCLILLLRAGSLDRPVAAETG
jgi:predicted MFS family arabinose efflux permease